MFGVHLCFISCVRNGLTEILISAWEDFFNVEIFYVILKWMLSCGRLEVAKELGSSVKKVFPSHAANYAITSCPLSGVPPMNGRRPAVV